MPAGVCAHQVSPLEPCRGGRQAGHFPKHRRQTHGQGGGLLQKPTPGFVILNVPPEWMFSPPRSSTVSGNLSNRKMTGQRATRYHDHPNGHTRTRQARLDRIRVAGTDGVRHDHGRRAAALR
ncbi:hypothetical protein NSND_50094 [Nitrospira sp. ND1]|nr:hypothetical protein NSND_50094 [Nitrospira sp. ND1]